MSMSPATVAAHAREECRSTNSAIRHHARHAVIAYRNLECWPKEEAEAALRQHMLQLQLLLGVKT